MEDLTSSNRKMRYVLFGSLATILLIFTIRYIIFLWRRRKLYILSWNIPGPLAFPFWGNAHLFYGGLKAFPKVFDSLARAHPDIFRLWLGPELVNCILKPEYIEKILCKKLDRADWVNEILSSNLGGTGLLFLPGTAWKRQRKIISPSFGQNVLNSYVEKFNDGAEILRDQLQKHVGEMNFGLHKMVFKFAVEIVCNTLMSVKVDIQTIDSSIADDLRRTIKIITRKIFAGWYHIDIIWKLSPLYRELNYLKMKMRKNYIMSEIYDKINRRKKNCGVIEETQDEFKQKLPFLDWILEHSDLTETEIKNEVDIFMIGVDKRCFPNIKVYGGDFNPTTYIKTIHCIYTGCPTYHAHHGYLRNGEKYEGSDTTTAALCCGMIAMGMYQDIQEKVYQEVMEICGPTGRILPSDMNKLKYTERVVKETLRLFPSAPLVIRKIDTDLHLDEHYTLPGGSSSVFFIRTIHTNPKYWPNPYEFDPDRFLPENVAKRHPCAYIPFSYGSRKCIGNQYAMMELLTTFAILIRRFKFFTEYKTIEEIKLIPTLVLELKDNDKVRLELR